MSTAFILAPSSLSFVANVPMGIDLYNIEMTTIWVRMIWGGCLEGMEDVSSVAYWIVMMSVGMVVSVALEQGTVMLMVVEEKKTKYFERGS